MSKFVKCSNPTCGCQDDPAFAPYEPSFNDIESDIAGYENDRQRLLQTAEQLVCGDRNKSYGAPTEDFTRTAAMWSAWKGVHFEPWEVAVFMVLLKQSRLRESPLKDDSWIDTAGYAACGLEVANSTLS